jgi:hypothetical protein
VMAAVGVDATSIGNGITTGTVVRAALM